MDSLNEYRRWCERVTEEKLARELALMQGDENQIKERFHGSLEFGTAGLRGIMGAGTAMMNIYTVRRASQGLADYINDCFGGGRVAVACDTRHNSGLFALETARVLAANGIAVSIFPRPEPTPVLSFAVRNLKCKMGVMITASHNPAQYNGYKVFGADGSQIGVTEADAVSKRIEAADIFDGVKLAECAGELPENAEYIGERLLEKYRAAVLAQSVTRRGTASRLKIVYTPLHGTGFEHVPSLLADVGVSELDIVECQKLPDGNFTTCEYPNPETREALAQGIAMCESTGAELLLATDPDADRVGVAVRDGDKMKILTGNEVGVLLLDFIIKSRRASSTMPENPVAVRSLVSTPMVDAVCVSSGVEMRAVPTGFKNIGEQILKLEQQGQSERFIFGFEESCGYLAGSYVRDKDAMVACMLIAELALSCKAKGTSICAVLERLYREHGYWLSKTENYSATGLAGLERIKGTMSRLRATPPKSIAGADITLIEDHLAGTLTNAVTGTTEPLNIARGDLIQWKLENGAQVIVRPSGTEPKLKAYLTVCEKTDELSHALMRKMSEEIAKIIDL